MNIKNRTYYLFNDIKIKNLDPNNQNRWEVRQKYFYLIDCLCDTKQRKSFLPHIKSSNRYIEECNGNKYLTIVPTDENRDILKQYEKMGKQSKTLLDQ